MNIYITERGLFSNDAHDYPVSHQNPVSRVNSIPKVTDEVSVIRETEKNFVAENTPAYNVSISSMGKAAVMSMNSIKEGFDSYYKSLLNPLEDTETATGTSSEEPSGIYGEDKEEDTKAVTDVASEDDSILTAYDNASIDETVPVAELQEEESVIGIEEVDDLESVSDETKPLGVMKDFEEELDVTSDMKAVYDDEAEDNKLVKDVQEVTSAIKDDPVMKQAIAAYNYQMAFQFNTQLTQ